MRTLRLFFYTVIIVAIGTAIVVLFISTQGVEITESEVRTVIVDTFLRVY